MNDLWKAMFTWAWHVDVDVEVPGFSVHWQLDGNTPVQLDFATKHFWYTITPDSAVFAPRTDTFDTQVMRATQCMLFRAEFKDYVRKAVTYLQPYLDMFENDVVTQYDMLAHMCHEHGNDDGKICFIDGAGTCYTVYPALKNMRAYKINVEWVNGSKDEHYIVKFFNREPYVVNDSTLNDPLTRAIHAIETYAPGLSEEEYGERTLDELLSR